MEAKAKEADAKEAESSKREKRRPVRLIDVTEIRDLFQMISSQALLSTSSGEQSEKNEKVADKPSSSKKKRRRSRKSEAISHNVGNVMANVEKSSCGFSEVPLQESVDLMEQIVREFLRELIQCSVQFSRKSIIDLRSIFQALRKHDEWRLKWLVKRYNSYVDTFNAKKKAIDCA
mmetsp:Transcript_24284/g.36428  ORF Transcript_24284/g.36428 Transcript_24284/m.36428 type:complete len:175 (-) Transcript_24284:112-636(-)